MTTLVFTPPGRRAAGRVLAHLDALTVTQRQVFVLYGAMGLSIDETARHVGLPRGLVSGIYAGACQRLIDITAEVFRGSPETSATQVVALSATTDCPVWCKGGCTPDKADGSTYHVSAYRELAGVPDVDLAVSRLDDEDTGPGPTTVDLFIGRTAAAELTPTQALALADLLREYALTAIGGAR